MDFKLWVASLSEQEKVTNISIYLAYFQNYLNSVQFIKHMFENSNILKIFFETPSKEFNVREIARLAKVAPSTASLILKKLNKLSILKERKERIYLLYKANLKSSLYKDMKIFYNIRKIKDSGLIESLNKFYPSPTIILFGSCSFGMDIESSDMDILIVSNSPKPFPEIKKFNRKLNKTLHIFSVKKVEDLMNEHLINNIADGILLHGIIKWNWTSVFKKGSSKKQK
jgi:predicted nucleotidyltransferase